MHSLISTFVVCLLESSIFKLATGEISIFLLASVAEQIGLSVSLSETPRDETHGATTCYLFACQCCLLITFANSLNPDQAQLSWA